MLAIFLSGYFSFTVYLAHALCALLLYRSRVMWEAGDDVSNTAMHVLMADDLLLCLDSDKE